MKMVNFDESTSYRPPLDFVIHNPETPTILVIHTVSRNVSRKLFSSKQKHFLFSTFVSGYGLSAAHAGIGTMAQ